MWKVLRSHRTLSTNSCRNVRIRESLPKLFRQQSRASVSLPTVSSQSRLYSLRWWKNSHSDHYLTQHYIALAKSQGLFSGQVRTREYFSQFPYAFLKQSTIFVVRLK